MGKPEFVDILKKRGVGSLLAETTPNDISNESKEKLKKWCKILFPNQPMATLIKIAKAKDIPIKLPITVVTGKETMEKNRAIVCMMHLFIELYRSVYFISAKNLCRALVSDDEFPESFLYVLVGIDALSQNEVKIVREFIFDHVRKERPIIISVIDIGELETVFGENFMYFISSIMVEVNIQAEKELHVIL